jgi:hypothetical protein
MSNAKQNLEKAFSAQRRQHYIDDFVAEKILNLGAVDNYSLRQQAEQSYQTHLQTQTKKIK